jgi:arylamine N-acetyltransferase
VGRRYEGGARSDASPHRLLGVRAKGESFLIDIGRCGDERVTSVAVRAPDASQAAVLWRIESTDRGSDRSRFVVGDDYKGFDTVVPFDGSTRPDALAIVEVRTDEAQAR